MLEDAGYYGRKEPEVKVKLEKQTNVPRLPVRGVEN